MSNMRYNLWLVSRPNSMANNISKTQIDKLGDRLRKGDTSEADLRLLDEYRRSFGEVYELVVGAIRSELGLEPTGRPAKSTTSISEKLVALTPKKQNELVALQREIQDAEKNQIVLREN